MRKSLQDKYSKLLFMDIVSRDNRAWFCNVCFGALFEVNLSDYSIKLLSYLPVKGISQFNTYSPIAYYEEKLIIFPCNEQNIIVFDLNTNSIIKEIPLDCSDLGEDFYCFNLFKSVIIVGDNAFGIPGRYPGIVKINLTNYELTVFDEWYSKTTQFVPDRNKVIFGTSMFKNGKILMPFWQREGLMSFDTSDYTSSIMALDDKTELIPSVADGSLETDDLFLVSCNDNAIHVVENNKSKEWKVIDSNFEFFGNGIIRMCRLGNKLFLFPWKGKAILDVDLSTKQENVSADCSNSIVEEQSSVAFVDNSFLCAKSFNDNCIIACSLYEGAILYYSILDDKWTRIPLDLPGEYDQDVEKYISFFGMKDMMIEYNTGVLENWIYWVSHK